MNTPAYKLQSPRVKEQDRLTEIVRYLRKLQYAGKILWFARINSGAAAAMGGIGKTRRFVQFYRLWLPRTPSQTRGVSDLIGLLADGRMFALEVKQPGFKASDEQAAFLACIRSGGGIAEVVTRFDEVEKLFNDRS